VGGPQSPSGRGGEEKNTQPMPGLEPPIIQLVVQRYITELLHSGFPTKRLYCKQIVQDFKWTAEYEVLRRNANGELLHLRNWFCGKQIHVSLVLESGKKFTNLYHCPRKSVGHGNKVGKFTTTDIKVM
jgi:hypothetical protein